MKTPDQVKAMVKAEFEKYDANGNGYLEKQEIRALLDDTTDKMNQPSVTAQQLDRIFNSLDADGDGRLTFEELYKFIGPLLAH